MLQVKNICKEYKTGSLVQRALDGVSLNLRENEFVAILGPSGSGKTTLLNIIGGLDRYDSGDLIINGISTKKYKDRDWDSYRNHTIGFVFQSYNLIPHQTVLANVELALTISGISKEERRKRASQALEQVGLGKQLHKKPNQMSGGQMQRVAIARALVNDPDILLADEPTGALDSDTSVQVMELLKEVAKDRLVVMVTHNPELAEDYATRIVKLRDGKIQSDSDPFEVDETALAKPVHQNMGKSSMSFLTALSLSFRNLLTKKARTLLTSFAGSIGIIGIALILSLSNGVNNYIQSVEEETLSEYPVQIQSTGMDFTTMMAESRGQGEGSEEISESQIRVAQMISGMLSRVDSNDLTSLKEYLDQGGSGVEKYANAVEYSYSAAPQIYRLEENEQIRQVNPDRSFTPLGIGTGTSTNSMMSMMMNTDVFHAMPENVELYENQYDLKAGRWPENYQECVLVLTKNGRISDFLLYTLGLRDAEELDEMVRRFAAEEEVEAPQGLESYDYEDMLGISFKLVNAADYYEYDETYDVWRDKTDDDAYMRQLVENGEDIRIVGVVQPSEEATAAMLMAGIGYPASLTKHVMEQAAGSRIVQEQLAKPGHNVLTGNSFGDDNQQSKFSMESLFTIDEEAFQKAFQFDEGTLNIDLSAYLSAGAMPELGQNLNLSQIQVNLPELSGLNLEDLLGQLQVSISADKIQPFMRDLVSGYTDYAASHPEADYSKLGESFGQYLRTPEAQQRLRDGLEELLASGEWVTVSEEELQRMLQNLMAGYQDYITASGIEDPSQAYETFLLYLQTAEAQQIISDGLSRIVQIEGDITDFPDKIEAISRSMMAGYQEYAAANQLPDPSKMGESFGSYLQTPEAQKLLWAGLSDIVHLDDLESQVQTALGQQLQGVMSGYVGALAQGLQSQVAGVMQQVMAQMAQSLQSGLQQNMSQLGAGMASGLQMNIDTFKNAVRMNMDENELAELLRSLMSTESASLDGNLKKLGYADVDQPAQISIYPKDFESKASIVDILEDYNSAAEESGQEEKVIRYTDVVGTLMSSVTDIVDIISYVLVAFVAISLVVSSIMIGVITYISVLERRKEIGILRAIGASKRNISQVFNAETFIIGLGSGVIGIGLTLLILIPGNAVIHSLAGQVNISASLPALSGLILVVLSILLTLIGGLIPSKKAAKSDPVAALRSE